MVYCIYMKWFCFLPEIAWTALGTYWAFTDAEGCKRYIVVTVKVAVLCAWVILLIILTGLLIVFDPQGSRRNIGESHHSAESSAMKIWENRYRIAME